MGIALVHDGSMKWNGQTIPNYHYYEKELDAYTKFPNVNFVFRSDGGHLWLCTNKHCPKCLKEKLMSSRGERQKFSEMIEQLAHEKSLTHIEVILEYCERTGLELEMIGSLVTASLKQKIEQEAIQMNALKTPKSNTVM